MYGTIFYLDVKSGHEKMLLKTMRGNTPKGMVAWFLMKPDDDDVDMIGVAVFESKEAYIANANSPEQHESITQMMNHLSSEPIWTDGTYVIGDIK